MRSWIFDCAQCSYTLTTSSTTVAQRAGSHESRHRQTSEDSFLHDRGSKRDRATSGRLFNLGRATRHHSSLMLRSFTRKVLAQLDLLRYWKRTTFHRNDVYLLLKHLVEKQRVSTFHEVHVTTPDTLITRSTSRAQRAWMADPSVFPAGHAVSVPASGPQERCCVPSRARC